ncbi:hypothetical protein [Rarobacter incanus]|uniref:Leucine rich repeat variant domain-containing protein n=1 Tax=Rarobacter incanus TaxID=153494 RepID=A0A542SNV7_9MICO|nr:hypothetical protein [Rarobacter incanus]TQK75937.1 hypothetical protein FB389_0581 [Rarobacter incanus]
MSQPIDPTALGPQDAANPHAPIDVLAAIANSRPDLHAALATNPAAPADLLQWLERQGNPQVLDALARRAAAPVGPVASAASPAGPVASAASPAGPPASPAGPPAPPAGPPAPSSEQAWAQPGTPDAGPLGGPASPAVGQWAEYPQQSPAFATGTPVGETRASSQFPVQAEGANPPKKSKAPVIVGLSVVGALIVAGGAFGAYKLLGNKAGAASPAASLEQTVDALANNDAKGLLANVSPVEVSYANYIVKAIEQQFAQVPALSEVTANAKPEDVAGLYALSASSMKYSQSTVVEGETSRATIDAGTIEVDVDADKTVAFVKKNAQATGKVASAFRTLGGQDVGTDESAFTAEDEADLRESIAKEFPATIQISGKSVTSTPKSGEATTSEAPNGVSVISVKEGSRWFVSPVLTAVDYAYAESDSSAQRGSIADVAKRKGADSPQAAAEAYVGAVNSALSSSHSLDALVQVLPTAEARAIAFAGPQALNISELEKSLGSVPPIEISNATFEQRGQDDGLARLKLATADVKVTTSGVSIEGTWAGECLSSPAFAQYLSREKFCLADDEFKGLRALGIDDLSLVAIKEGSGWYISTPVSAYDAIAVVFVHLYQLADAGTLNAQWFSDNFAGLQQLFGGTSASASSLEDQLSGLDDDESNSDSEPQDGTLPSADDPDADDSASDLGVPDDSGDASVSSASLESDLTQARKAAAKYLADSKDIIWPDAQELADYGFDAPSDMSIAFMAYTGPKDYCIGGYQMPNATTFVQGSIDAQGKYYADTMMCGA